MAEEKNNFIGGRMNKDFDERLIADGEYRDARNISVSSSDTGNSGSISNVLGNVLSSSFGLSDRNLECIGYYADIEGSRVIAFLTNYTDSSPSTQDNFAAAASSHYIVSYDVRANSSTVLVKGNFLNFSKTHRIIQVNLLEDLLFWTDDRNQPRKINLETAIAKSGQIDVSPYYSKEEHISVAKYYPFNPINLYDYSGDGRLNSYNHSLFERITQIFDTAVLPTGTTTTYTYTVGLGNPTSDTSGSGSGAVIDVIVNDAGNVSDIQVTSGGTGFAAGDTITFTDPVTPFADEMIVELKEEDFWIEPTMKDTTSLLLPYSAEATANAWGNTDTGTFVRSDATQDLSKFIGCLIYVQDSNGEITVPISSGVKIDSIDADGSNVDLSAAISIPDNTYTIHIGANPYYNATDVDTISNIRDKFVRFAYRFKFDDDEYSLISPFTQSVFVPKQAGHFTGTSDEIDKDEQETIASSNVDFFENSITEVGLVIDLPEGISTVSELFTSLKVKAVDILYKDSNEPSVKVVKTIKENELISNQSPKLKYTYKSTKPIKVLPESDVVRVFDKIPVRAKAQEIVANRVVYGNYVEAYAAPETLDYSASYGDKGYQHEYDDAFSRREYPNHTLKQNRTYQVGIVLCDKFGRKSAPIISDNSTVFSKYAANGFRMIDANDVYMGDALRVLFNESIPEQTENPLYRGIYDANTNPMGWYSYQIVVKQKEQSYYNAYIPTILNGYPKTASAIDSDLAHITLVGDNINKIPRDFELSADLDGVYRSKTQVYPRIVSDSYTGDHESELKLDITSPNKVSLIGGRDELGLNKTEGGAKYDDSPFFSIPEVFDPASPDLLNRGSNPLIARISTREAIGAEGGNTNGTSPLTDGITFERLNLNVVETRPMETSLELFWETSTAGLVSDINTEVLIPANSDGIPYQVADFQFTFSEGSANGSDVSSEFIIQDFSGDDILNANTASTFLSVKTKSGADASSLFLVEKVLSNNKFKLTLNTSAVPYYGKDSWKDETYDIVMGFSNLVNGETVTRNIVLKDNAMINELPTFAEDTSNIGNVSTLVTYSTNAQLGISVIDTNWREIANATIANGAGVFAESLKELNCRIDSVEWFNSSDSTWYNYWYYALLRNQSTVVTRNPNPLVRVVFTGNASLQPKILYSPLLQWGWHDREVVSQPSTAIIDSNYTGETATLFQNYSVDNQLSQISAKTGRSGSLDAFNFSEDLDLLPTNYAALTSIPSDGLQEVDQTYRIIPYGFFNYNRNIQSQAVLTTDMPVRVTFTLLDASNTGFSKQFTALFDVQYGGFQTFNDL